LQCVAVCCSAFMFTPQGPFVGSKEGLRVAVCCSVLQCVAVRCSAFTFTSQGPFVGSKEGLRASVM